MGNNLVLAMQFAPAMNKGGRSSMTSCRTPPVSTDLTSDARYSICSRTSKGRRGVKVGQNLPGQAIALRRDNSEHEYARMSPQPSDSAIHSISSTASQAFQAVKKETEVYVRALRGNFFVFTVSHACISLSYACLLPELTPFVVLRVLGLSFLYMFPMMAQSDFGNQSVAAAEDALSKPYRPLPMGLVTKQGMIVRTWVWSVLHIVVCFAMGFGWLGVLWIAAVTNYNFYDGAKHWFNKNVMLAGTYAFANSASAWLLVHGEWSPSAVVWVAGLSLWMGWTVILQDYKDVEGDREIGRKTLPVLYGDASRYPVAAILLLSGALSLGLTYLNSSVVAVATAITLCAGHLWLAYRLIFLRTEREDEVTYHHWAYIVCILWGSAALWLQAPTAALLV